jgi:hypothetical protein
VRTNTATQGGRDPATAIPISGVDPRFRPTELDGRVGMWRDRIAGQRALQVLDNAASSSQVAPLLPGGEGCLALVTSRHLSDLPGTVVPVLLDTLPPQKAEEMFARLAPRAAGSPGQVAEVVRLAGFLPLAISLLARIYARHQAWTLADLAAETKANLPARRATARTRCAPSTTRPGTPPPSPGSRGPAPIPITAR